MEAKPIGYLSNHLRFHFSDYLSRMAVRQFTNRQVMW